MTEIETPQLREALEKRRSGLMAHTRRLSANATELPDLIALRLIKETISQVEKAILECEKGEYGRCIECGNSINPERLRVLPEATVCVKCAHRDGCAKQTKRVRHTI